MRHFNTYNMFYCAYRVVEFVGGFAHLMSFPHEKTMVKLLVLSSVHILHILLGVFANA